MDQASGVVLESLEDNIAADTEWAPFEHNGYIYSVFSREIFQQEIDGGRKGHWLYKINKTTLEVL